MKKKVSRKKKSRKHPPKPKPPKGKARLNLHHSLRQRKGQSTLQLEQRILPQELPLGLQLKRLRMKPKRRRKPQRRLVKNQEKRGNMLPSQIQMKKEQNLMTLANSKW